MGDRATAKVISVHDTEIGEGTTARTRQAEARNTSHHPLGWFVLTLELGHARAFQSLN